jgi:hypothetical protein
VTISYIYGRVARFVLGGESGEDEDEEEVMKMKVNSWKGEDGALRVALWFIHD